MSGVTDASLDRAYALGMRAVLSAAWQFVEEDAAEELGLGSPSLSTLKGRKLAAVLNRLDAAANERIKRAWDEK